MTTVGTRWPELIKAACAAILADATLAGIFGENVLQNEEMVLVVPSLLWTIVGNTESERYETVLVQWTLWLRSTTDQAAAEGALRKLFARDVPYRLGDVATTCEYRARNRLEGPQDGTIGVAVDYQFEVLRERYVPA